MYAKLTYTFFLSCAACLVSACSSDAPENPEVSKGAELSFAVADLSRASVTSKFNDFAVYGEMKKNAGDQANPIVIFNGTEVRYNGEGWRYEGTQYWYPDYEYSFVGVNPLSMVGAANTPRYADSKLSFTYTIPTSAGKLQKNSDVTDIIVATHRRLYETDEFVHGTITSALLRFRHILSLINIAPKLDDRDMNDGDRMYFHNMELSGFRTKATFNIQPAPRQSNPMTDDGVIEIGDYAGEASFTIQFPQPKELKNHGTNVKLFDDDDALIMLPQIFGTDSEAKIVLTYTINNDSQKKQLIIPLNNMRWESGASYTYKITVDRMGLKLSTTTITDWELVNNSFDAIIE